MDEKKSKKRKSDKEFIMEHILLKLDKLQELDSLLAIHAYICRCYDQENREVC